MTTTTIQTSEELEAQLDSLRNQHAAALERLDAARDERNRTAGMRALGEVDAETLAEAHQAVTDAESAASSLASAIALVEERHAEAIEREREERRTSLAGEADTAARRRAKALRAIGKSLSAVRDAFGDLDAAAGDLRGIRRALVEVRDVEAEVAAIEQRWHERVEQLRREAPPGQEPNYPSLERRREDEIAAVRSAAEREARELAPDAAAEELAAIIDGFADIAPRLLDSASRRSLSEGGEFVTRPQAAYSTFGAPMTSTRLYGEHEYALAEQRHDAFLDALRRLAGGPAPTIAQEQDRRLAAMGLPAGGHAYSLGSEAN